MLTALLVSSLLHGAPMTPKDAEQYARAHWFSFELTGVTDWVAFVKDKQEKERALTEEARKGPPPRMEEPLSDDEARARRVLQQEFNEVAMKREDEIRALAKKILSAMQKGDFEPAMADCTMYDAKATDRLGLTKKYFAEHKATLQKAAKVANPDAPDFAKRLQFTRPSPETGIPGKVTITFGPPAPAPKDTELYPPTHELELWWSGEVMPEANGPHHAVPTTPTPKSRWRFFQLFTPYSQQRRYLE